MRLLSVLFFSTVLVISPSHVHGLGWVYTHVVVPIVKKMVKKSVTWGSQKEKYEHRDEPIPEKPVLDEFKVIAHCHGAADVVASVEISGPYNITEFWKKVPSKFIKGVFPGVEEFERVKIFTDRPFPLDMAVLGVGPHGDAPRDAESFLRRQSKREALGSVTAWLNHFEDNNGLIQEVQFSRVTGIGKFLGACHVVKGAMFEDILEKSLRRIGNEVGRPNQRKIDDRNMNFRFTLDDPSEWARPLGLPPQLYTHSGLRYLEFIQPLQKHPEHHTPQVDLALSSET